MPTNSRQFTVVLYNRITKKYREVGAVEAVWTMNYYEEEWFAIYDKEDDIEYA